MVRSLGELEDTIAPGLRLPPLLGGHLVRSDARVDLVYVLGSLAANGVDEISGVDLTKHADEVIRGLDPYEVEGFFAYRVAEAVRCLGGLSILSRAGREQTDTASDSRRLVHEIAAGDLTRRANFRVVAARCLLARRELGLPVDGAIEQAVMGRVAELFATAHGGWIDDGRPEEMHFDIYSPEMYLLAEPLKNALEPDWGAGLNALLRDLGDLGRHGGVVTWGRSIGALSLAIALELSTLSQNHVPIDAQAWWTTQASDAAQDLEGWFSGGLVTAHQSRTSDLYRGPARRLQLTLDLLGKVAWSALRMPDDWPKHAARIPPRDVDHMIELPRGASIWTYRSRPLTFVLPMMRGATADYLPSPRARGTFEQPVAGFPLLVPTLITPGDDLRNSSRHVPSGPPSTTHHSAGLLDVFQDQWAELARASDRGSSTAVDVTRHASYRVAGRGLQVDEHLHITNVPAGTILALAAGDTNVRGVQLEVDGLAKPTTASTAGMSEWQTHWDELQRVHEVSTVVESGTDIRFRWSVTPDILLATTEPDHQYSRFLYPAMPGVATLPAGPPDVDLGRRLRDVDVVHLAWPERWPGINVDSTLRAIDQIRSSDTAIVWTQHNLIPHRDRSAASRRVYELWAEAADGVIHHSEYGRRRALATYEYRTTLHFVIPHGHWGSCFPEPAPARSSVEREEGWAPANIRLAIIGRPRADKALQEAVDAFHEVSRSDMQLVARLGPDVRVPPDSRIVLLDHVSSMQYYRRLTAVDGIVLPFVGETMLTTGTAFDCIGGGIAPIASDWGYLDETFGDAAIWYSPGSLTSCLDSLTDESLRRSGAAAAALRGRHRWDDVGRSTAHAIAEVVTDISRLDAEGALKCD
ncbi:MAG: hypothetical protein WKF72_09735 [Nocardioidaceae bacterium]